MIQLKLLKVKLELLKVSNVNLGEIHLIKIYFHLSGSSKYVPCGVPFYANNSTSHILSGFFANIIVLVEGLTEELALPIYFEKLGFDPTEFGVEIIGVGGKGSLAKWWRFFTLYQIPTFICFDNDYKKMMKKVLNVRTH